MIGYLELLISRHTLLSPLKFEVSRVDCIWVEDSSGKYLTLFILETHKRVLWQTVKTQIRVCTVPRCQSIILNLEILTCDPLISTMTHPSFIVSKQMDESISIHGVR